MLSANQATARVGTNPNPTASFDPPVTRNGLDRLMASPSRLDQLAPPLAHVVAEGDTLSDIAAKHGTTWQTLARINGLSDPDRLTIGQPIRLPASDTPATHVVRRGETLSGIAQANGLDVATLTRTNHLANPDRIAVGQTLRLSGSAPAPQTAPAAPANAPVNTPASAAPRLGAIAERYERGGRGPGTVSTGSGDPGGVSYGVYQLSSNAGTLQKFLANEGKSYAAELGTGVGSEGFNATWKAIAARDPQGFRAAQHAFIDRTHYQPAVDGVKATTGLDLSSRHAAVREATWSTSVQHGGAQGILNAAISKTDAQVDRTSADYDRKLVDNIYAGRADYLNGLADNGKYTAKEAAQLRSIAATRYPNERRDVAALFEAAPAAATASAAPATAAEARTAADFAKIVETSGDAQARADLAAGKQVLVAIRTDSTTGAHNGQGDYNDRFALLSRAADGSYRAQTFQGNTEPAGKYAARGYGVDVNGDGRKELGRLVEGSYRYELQPGNFAGNRFFRATETQQALRDSNHDGRFTAADTIDRSGAGRSMLIHQGGNGTTGSAGCQTLNPADFAALLKGLGTQHSFSYVLVNANR
ncbi:LysM peptidoglycan-binding domain-containing protein [Sphingomonas phyllosphaerae]|uniref:LysM peptidoglycan-binding domain-containing protein n=1 Tax=Sphingomonas phyllosphaerae TaxID=257003 RepID=UPI0004127ED4|nr:LysM peptidoglycan-binding domain-containing protein [Sphingomonas phyllosphaerae]